MTPATAEQPAAPPPRLAQMTVDQYHRMLEAGILKDGDPVELIDGVMVCKDRSARGDDKMTIGKRHRKVVTRFMDLAPLVKSHGATLFIQSPVTIAPYGEPEPDCSIVRGTPDDYDERHPEPADVHCVIEVAESSLAYDRTTKLRMYAQAGIAQYVLVDLVDLQIEVYEQPVSAEGRYALSTVVRSGQTLGLSVGPGQRLDVPAGRLLS